jgi:hypothetical protein
MSSPEVGSGEVAIVPTFKGFRAATEKEVDGAAKAADTGFRKAFAKTGDASGKTTGAGFKKAFEQESSGFSSKAAKELEDAVAKSSRAVSTARLKEQDAAGKVRLAEAQLAEARDKYAADSSQVIRAEERLAASARQLGAAQNNTKEATNELRTAQGRLADAADAAGDQLAAAGRRSAGRFTSGFKEILGGSFLGSAFGGIASSVTAGISNVIGSGFRAGWDLLKESTVAASGLNESLNAVNVSFGDAAAGIQELGKGAAQRLGLTTLQFNGFATQFAAFASTIRGNDVTGFIDELTVRGADFASVYNLEVADALQLFQSGLAGETEPLRKFGIDLSAAAVSAYAVSSGMVQAAVDTRKVELAQGTLSRATETYSEKIKAFGEESTEASAARDAVTRAEIALEGAMAGSNVEMTEAQKQQARYGLLLQQTQQTQGDFANTSGELANQQRILNAEWANAQAKLGTALLPSLTTLAQLANETLVPALNDTIDKIGPELATALQESTPALVDLVKTTVEYLPSILQLGSEALPLLIAGAQAIIPLLQMWTDNQAGLATIVGATFNLFSSDTSVEELADEVLGAAGAVGVLLRGVYDVASGFRTFASTASESVRFARDEIGSRINEAVGFIQSLPQRAIAAVGDLGMTLYNSGRSLINGFLRGIRETPVGQVVGGVLDTVRGFFPNSPAKYGPFSGAGWDRLRQSGGAVIEQFQAGMVASSIRVPIAAAAVGGLTLTQQLGDRASPVPGGGSGGATVNQYIRTEQTDPRLQMRQWGREARGALNS